MSTVRRRFRGAKALGAALMLTIVAAPVLAGLSTRHGAFLIGSAMEATALAILAALLAAGTRRGTVVGDIAYSGRAFLPRRRVRSSAGRARRPKAGPAPEYSTTVRRFRLEEFTGTSIACVLVGDQSDGQLNDGDYVHVTGRRSRGGELNVRQVSVLSSANGVTVARISARRRGEFTVAMRTNRVALCLAGLQLCGLAVLAAVLLL